jgi:hypothetical protein
MKRTAGLLLTLLALTLGGCANSTYATIQAEKKNPEFKAGAGKKTLVIVATADRVGRENLETQFAIEGVDRKIDLEPSHRMIGAFKDITRDAVMDLVKTNSYDRVMIVRVVPGSITKGEHGYLRDYYSIMGSGLAYPYLNDYWGGATYVTVFSPTDPPPPMTSFHNLELETALYDAADGSFIWSSVTKINTSREHGVAAKDFVRTVVGRMRSASLL